ncbi:type 1 fimbrial protein [Serratia marcescens]|uniref:fimbrial protein n=1 Tax=Serratia TaxID=613 RepID=UPI000669259F|nr:fimbrial protein [Serratia marcescens]SBL87327.1 type-1 fimbrial protein subunit A [Klebsiella oxytoca]MBI6135889.1 type 1 fimbrial protein [Serratia marcescens]MDN0029177.1 fimbrial protein [Serratia marcescens]NSM20111.1 fimbrial protein [Serratia marcescens]NSM49014.1 fimbrial protein [Serratia marcescens]
MKSIIKGLLLVGSGLTFSAYAADGSVDMELTLAHGTCNLTADSKNMQVQLGNISRAELASIGATSNPVDFTIRATDCAPGLSVEFRFDGVATSQNDRAFALDSGSVAEGVGVQLNDSDYGGSNIKYPNYSYGYQSNPGKDGTFSKAFQARYIALAEKIIPGTANVTTQLNLTYD